ncbi:MAG: Rhs family protein, partial [Myxococcaceae bacterium]|nr:Rhs family protein [Myxococcaceae bacterium]
GWSFADSGTTIQFGDVDGDGFADVCGRGDAGMICALNDKSKHFERPHQWSNTSDFSDDASWDSSASRYGSIRLGDINGDGRADVCGHAASGIVCGISLGQAFEQSRPMLPVDFFTDANGYNATAYGASLALVRVNGDARRDLCIRGKTTAGGTTIGLSCALAP